MAKVYGSRAQLQVQVTGSGGLAVSKWLSVPFVQEVVAAAVAVQAKIPQTDVAIELGGEDAKITYFGRSVEQRMNGTCAGGTGAFIDQMAALLETDATGLNELAKTQQRFTPSPLAAGLCKTDVQPLINEGARREDIAASIFRRLSARQYPVLHAGNQSAAAAPFRRPLHFLDQLRQRFIETLHLTDDEIIVPEKSELFVALGAALSAGSNQSLRASPHRTVNNGAETADIACTAPTKTQLLRTGFRAHPSAPPEITNTTVFIAPAALTVEILRNKLGSLADAEMQEVQRLTPLFENDAALAEFRERHGRERAETAPLETAPGPVFLGMDAGSTTTKAVLIDQEGESSGSSTNRMQGTLSILQ